MEFVAAFEATASSPIPNGLIEVVLPAMTLAERFAVAVSSTLLREQSGTTIPVLAPVVDRLLDHHFAQRCIDGSKRQFGLPD
jgi:hypothetical protein